MMNTTNTMNNIDNDTRARVVVSIATHLNCDDEFMIELMSLVNDVNDHGFIYIILTIMNAFHCDDAFIVAMMCIAFDVSIDDVVSYLRNDVI